MDSVRHSRLNLDSMLHADYVVLEVWTADSVYRVPLAAIDSVSFAISYISCPDSHHPRAIDLGLPSGTKWACCNVGATTPERYGGYYAWVRRVRRPHIMKVTMAIITRRQDMQI